MFSELISSLPERFAQLTPFRSSRDRAFWKSFPDATTAAIVVDGEQFIGYEYPTIPATLYMDFSRTGNRSRFEDRYFARRRALNALVLAECVCGDGRFLDDIVNGIDALCCESAWQLPAHNSYVRDGTQLVLPDTQRPILDLFACETGAQLAMISYLLADVLDSVDPSICERIGWILRERILTPYLNTHFWWMGNGDEPMCNWTPWCTQNILLVAGILESDQERLRIIIETACGSLDSFVKDYGDDGCCSEGAQYYRHAGLCLFGAIEFLEQFAPNVFSPLYALEKIRNIALYALNMHVDGDYYINFADCSPIAGNPGAREYLFGKRIASEPLMRYAAEGRKRGKELTLPNEINLFYRVQELAFAREMADFANCLQDTTTTDAVPADAASMQRSGDTVSADPAFIQPTCVPLPDAWYPSVGLLVTRSPVFCLAVKAGGNGDSHNHNDTGSFTVYKNGQPCIIDIGVESYTAKTFSPRRYEIWTMQSAWHNLPTFGPWMQHDGAEFRSRDVVYKGGNTLTRISMELEGAWVPESGVVSYQREVAFDKPGGVILVDDRYNGTHEPVMSLMTALEPTISPAIDSMNGLAIEGSSIAIGKLARVEVNVSSVAIRVEAVDISDLRLLAAWGDRIYRVSIRFENHLTLRIK